MTTTVIEYAAHSRGYHLKVVLSNQKALVSQGIAPENPIRELAISDADWKELITYFEAVKLEELSTLKDPTQKRFYDGAAIAHLKIKYKETTYETVDFDHGFPPLEIEKLVHKIVVLAKANE
jgi:hypothetical protein